MKRPIVKVCGMRDADNIKDIEALGIDWMGFIFYPKSPRAIASKPDYLPRCKRVGVFVNASIEDIVSRAAQFGLDAVQLHGSEQPQFISQLANALRRRAIIIKAFSIATCADLDAVQQYAGLSDYYLFDTKCAGHGGSGQAFDWSILDAYQGDTPFILSGGIAPESAPALSRFTHPKCVGIDLNSRFELAPGMKDAASLSKFLSQINKDNTL